MRFMSHMTTDPTPPHGVRSTTHSEAPSPQSVCCKLVPNCCAVASFPGSPPHPAFFIRCQGAEESTETCVIVWHIRKAREL